MRIDKPKIVILSLTLAFYTSLSNRIFDFDGQISQTDFSSAVLANIPETTLPKEFILCSSHFQRFINTKNVHSIYVIYQEEEMLKPWLSFGIWSKNILWVNIAYDYWYNLGIVPSEFMIKWLHICLKIDIAEKTIEANVNGRAFKNVSDVMGLTPTPKFNLRLGIVHTSDSTHTNKYQFDGQVANIHLIKDGKRNLTILAKSTCEMEESTNVFHWSDMIWSKVKINEKFLDKSFICQDKYSLLINPYTWDFSESKHLCSKFGNGQIAGIVNPANPKNVSILKQIYGSDHGCGIFRTPYIYYENSSGEVVDIYTNTKLDILWSKGFPVKASNVRGFTEVFFYPNKRHFENTAAELKACLLCNSSDETIYSIRGSCPFSLMG